jgi:hypothetical protein
MKARKVLLWIVGVPLALYAVAYAVRFQTTKPIEGVLVDARTGRPVSKALVHANWLFMYPNLVDTSSGGSGFGTVTDENGRFRIPRRNVTSVFRRFADQSIIVKHPLYAPLEKQVYVQSYKEYRMGKVEGRTLKLSLLIESLEDKYSKPEDNRELQWVIGNCGPAFYESMRDHFNTRYDLTSIMAHLEYLATRFPEEGPHASGLRRTFTEHKFHMSKFLKSY